MGLDVVELIMRIEEEFDIELDDTELSNSRTVGELYEMVVRRLEPQAQGRCLSQMAFQRLRRVLIERFGMPRCAIVLELPLDAALPRAGRREVWADLQRRMGLALPPLQLPDRVLATAAAVPLAAGLAGWAAGSLLVAGLVFVPGSIAWSKLVEPFAIEYPVADVRALTREVLHQNFADFVQTHELTRAQVWERIVELTVEQLAVEREQVTREARWTEDLRVC